MPVPVGETVTFGEGESPLRPTASPTPAAAAPATDNVVVDTPPPPPVAVPEPAAAADALAACAAVITFICVIVAATVCPWKAADAAMFKVPLAVGVKPAAVARPAALLVTVSTRAPLNDARPFWIANR